MKPTTAALRAVARRLPSAVTKKKTPKLPLLTEHQEQVAFFRRVDLDPRTRDLLIYAVPNFSGRLGKLPPIAAIRQAQRLNAEGRRRGVPDIAIDEPRPDLMAGEYHGARIEMKRKGSKGLSDEQSKWLLKLRARGYCTAVCYSAEEAWVVLCEYLGIPL